MGQDNIQEKPKEKQNGKSNGPGRKQMWALWAAALSALGSTGIPKIVELLETKPSTEQVQTMIAKQTEALTDELNDVVDALKVVEKAIGKLEPERQDLHTATAKLEARVQFIHDVLRTCCTRSVDRVEKDAPVAVTPKKVKPLIEEEEHPAMVMIKDVPLGVPDAVFEVVVPDAAKTANKPFDRLNKLPRFDQQQVQMQMQEE